MADLDIFKLTKQWFDFCQSGESIVRPVHSALYLYSIHLCNKLRWPKIFGIPTEATMNALGISSYKTYITTFKELVDFGFIQWVEKSTNQFTSNKIALVKNAKASPKHIPKQVQSIVGIVKHVNNKNVVNVEDEKQKTVLVNLFRKVRSDVPYDILIQEAGKFLVKYPGKSDQKNLINTWASKIKYETPVKAIDEFNRIEAENLKKYGQ